MTTTSSELSALQRELLAARLRGALGHAGGITQRGATEAPLSPVQHGLWVVDQFLDDNALYAVHRDLWLHGELDTAALAGAVDDLVARHEILRTTYAGDTEPVSVLGPPVVGVLDVVDLSGQPPERAQEMAVAALRRPFDLVAGPVFRATLYRLATDEHLLLLHMHHMVSDGWSCAVLGRDLAELYSARVQGRRPDLPALPVQYADYAAWQAKRMAGALGEKQLAHWRAALGAVQPVLRLPTDRPHPARPTYRADRLSRTLTPAATERVRALAQASGVTVFGLVLAAFEVVLARCSGQDSFAVGSLTSGREQAETEHLLGLFANTVAIPADLSGDITFAGLLARTRDAVLGTLGNADVSFDDVVTAVAPVREPGRNALFQVLFQFIEVNEERWGFHGLDVRLGDAHNDLGKLDLTLYGINRPDTLELQLEYAADLFDAPSAARYLDRVLTVLDRVVADPHVRLSDVDVLAPDERALVLHGWNDTAFDVPRGTLGELFEAAVAAQPDAPAVVAVDGTVTTYRELNAAANRLAHHLRGMGVGPESVVGVCVESSVDMLVALLGVVKSGGVYVPLDPEHPADRLAYLLADTGAEIVVARRGLAELPARAVFVDEDRSGEPDHNPEPVATADNLVYVMYTSGSTGRPKGVMISHLGLINYLWWAIDGYGVSGEHGAPMLGSIAVDLSVPNFFLPLITGKDVTLLPADRSLSALADMLAAPGDFSLLKLTPGHLDVLRSNLSEVDRIGSVRTYVVGADEVRPETVAAWREIAPGARIIDEYGPTETVVGCSTYLIDEDFDPSVPVSIGRPIGNIRMYVLDEHLNPLPVGAVGELCIGGLGVARGYWGRPGLTAEKFVPEPFGAPGDRMYRTGDLARFRADGNLEFLGRVDHQVKIRGYRVELGEIEARLLLHPDVSEAVVVAREDSPGHKRLAGYLVAAGYAPDPAVLRAHLAATLPEHMVPATLTVLDRMPLTQAGKVDRAALPSPDRLVAPASVAPSTETELILAGIWADVLGVEVGVHDDFFTLGGDSILSIRIGARAREAGIPVTVRQVFEHRTVAALAAAVEPGPVVRVHAKQGAVTGTVPLTPILRWFTDTHGDLAHYNQSVTVECTTDPAVLRQALAAVVRHHDALRLRLRDGAIDHATEVPDDLLRVVPGIRREDIADDLQASLSPADGQLLRAALFSDGLLLIAVHHIAVDTVSWDVLLADLDTACTQLEAGQDVRLPAKTTSFRDWALRLRDAAVDAPAVAPGTDLPLDHDGEPATEATTAWVDVTLPAEALLRQAPAAYHTEITDLLLAALGGALTEWAGGPVTVDLEGHGREPLFDDVDLTRTVGWFTALRPVCLPPVDGDWGTAITTVKEHLRAAPHHGIGHGLAGRPGPSPQVCVNYLGQLDRAPRAGRFPVVPEPLGATRSPAAVRPYLLDVTAVVEAGALHATFAYSTKRHNRSTVEAVATRFTALLTELVEHCRTGGRATPSDFPLAGLDQATLDRVLADLGPVEDVYPLSPLQSGMLFRAVYEPETRDYFEQNGFVVREGVDVPAFVSAWQHVVDRHAALRTVFAWAGLPAPVQVVLRGHRLPVEVLDWSDVPGESVAHRFADLMRAERDRGFDLTTEPPCRLVIVSVSAEEHHVLWTFHHVVLDAWSVSAVLAEVFTAYAALRTGAAPELGPVTPFRDHMAWLSTQDKVADAEFWRRELADLSGPTTFPAPTRTAGSVPPAESTVERARLALPAEVAARGAELANRCGCTLGTVVQAAWALLLSRYTGETDVLFGTTVAGRSAPVAGIEDVVGMLINTLPTRVAVEPSLRVREFLAVRHAKQVALRDREHCALVDVQRCTDIPPGTPLFDNILVYENFMATRAPSAGLVAEPSGEVFEQTDCPLVVEVSSHDTIEIVATYHRARYDRATADRLLRHFGALIGELAADPDRPLWQLDPLSADERRQVLHDWNDTALDVPRSTLGELFEAAVAKDPAAPAVRAVDGTVTSYGELNAAVNRLAHLLRAKGVTAETVVGVCVESSVDVLVALLGVAKAGGTYVPLDPEHPADRLAFMVADTGARVVVTQRHLTALAASFGAETLVLVGDEAAQPEDNLVPVSTPDNLVYVMYTSGSTGRPKGVMISHLGLINYLWWAIDGYGVSGAHGAPMLGSIAFDLSVPNFFLPLITGKDVTLLPTDRSLSALADLLAAPGDFSLLKLTPGHLDVLRGHLSEVDHVDSVRTFVVGADEVRPETVAAWREIAPGARIIDEYGPTETVVGCSTYLIDEDFDPSVPVSIGRPIGNIRMYVLDEYLNPLPVGAIGELCIGGLGVARGYWGRPGLTAEKFVPEPYGAPGDRMYRTGDLARFRPDGNLEFLGRVDHQVKIRGYRVELGEIEARLLLHPDVSEAVVDVRADATGHKRLIGYVVPVADLDLAQLRDFLAAELPDYMIPSIWVVLDAMPLTQAGKVNRKAMPDPETVRHNGSGHVAPRTDAERALAAIWADLLGVDEVGVHDDFFALGGDSILSIQAAGRARAAGTPVTVRQLFEARTIAELVRLAPSAVVAEQGVVTGELPLTPILRWFTETHGPADHYNQSALLRWATPIDPATLSAALDTLLTHHDALRLRLSTQDGEWAARIADLGDPVPLRVVGAEDDEEAICAGLQAGLSLVDGPLVAAALLPDDRLFLVVHHVAVDTVSWGILLDDLARALAGEALPAKTTSFREWAHRLAEHEAPPAAVPDVPLPTDHDLGPNTEESARTVELSLPAGDLVRGGAVLAALTTALAGAIAEHADRTAVTVELEGHGREPLADDVDITRTIGWFTTTRPVRCDLSGPTWTDRRAAVAAAIEGTGDAHRPEVVLNYHGRHQRAADGPFEVLGTLGVDRDPRLTRPHLFDIDCVIDGDDLRVTWTYSANRHTAATVERLAARFADLLAGLATEESYRLSPLQAGMLVAALSAPGADPYYLQWNLDLEGDLDVAAFEAAWEHVLARHPVLRSRFAWDGLPHPVQLVDPATTVHIDHWDARTVPDREAWLTRLAADERAEGIDLTAGPLTRLALVRTGERTHRLVWNTHHIVLDRWSRDLVEAELFACYTAFAAGGTPQLSDPVPYRDFIAHIGTGTDTARSYWAAAFTGFAGPTPAPDAAPTGEPAGMAVLDLPLGADLGVALRAASQRHRVTAGTLAQAAWALLLSSRTGHRDVGFDLTVAGRSLDLPGIERVVGMVINTVPARVGVDPDAELATWLRHTQDAQVERYAHEHHSLVDITRWTGVGRRMSDTRFVFESPATTGEVPPSPLRVTDVSDLNGDTEYALVLAVGGDWTAQVRYDRARYTEAAATKLLANYQSVLSAIATAPDGARLHTITDLTATTIPLGVPAAAPPTESREPATDTERVLAQVWHRVLGHNRFSTADDFFAVGGNSILVFQVVEHAHRAALDLTVRQALLHRTIAELAATVTTTRLDDEDLPMPPGMRQSRTGPAVTVHLVECDADQDRLSAALAHLVTRHDALRVRVQGDRLRFAADPGPRPPVGTDPGAVAALLDPATGPLIGAAVLPAGVLLIAHRVAVDAASWPILAADLTAFLRGEPAPGPAPAYADWARALARSAPADAAYWQAERPPAHHLPCAGSETATVTLRDDIARFGCTIDEAVLATAASVVADWLGTADITVLMAATGRVALTEDHDPARTVGAFATTFPLSLHLPDEGRLTAVREQVRAVPHGGLTADTTDEATLRFVPSGVAADPAPGLTVRVDTARREIRWTGFGATMFARRHGVELVRLTAAPDRPTGQAGRLLDGLFPHAPALVVPMAAHRVPGLGVAVLHDGEIHAWGQGRADDAGTPVDERTLFPACSVSKHVSTIGILRLVQDGVLDLDTDIARYLTSWRVPDGPPITLRALLSHTAGLVSGGYRDYPRTEKLPGLAPMLSTVVRKTGGQFHYSNANYAVVQQVVADVTGRDTAELMTELVLDPLGMRDSSFRQEPNQVAHGHDENGAPVLGGWRITPEWLGSGLFTTPADVARAELAILRAVAGEPGAILDASLARAMVTPGIGGYGLGTTTSHADGARWFGHPGDRRSHQSVTAVDLDTGAGLVVMANAGGAVPVLADLVTRLRLSVRYLIG